MSIIEKEVCTFEISKNMIFHTIESQAGSVEKAILECLMNAVDAGATKVEVDIYDNGIDYTIKDNGVGFKTKEEILECFGVFGFDHGTEEENTRTYGTFGIGRAQLWAFSKNTWKTNGFELEVDIKNKGLDYTLSEVRKEVCGCTIEGKFYEKLSILDIQNTIRELKKFALYMPIDVFINGNLISKDPNKQNWNYKTEEAYIKLNETGDLKIYNLGVYVCSYPNYRFGKGGVVLSHKQLKLNTARNDILASKCSAWRKIKTYLEDNIKKDTLSRKTLNDDMRKNLIMQWIAGGISYNDIKTKGLIPDIKGKAVRINSIPNKNNSISLAECMGSQVGENIHQNNICFILSPKALDWFNVESCEEFVKLIRELYLRDVGHSYYMFDRLKVVDFKELKKKNSSNYIILSPEAYTKKQKVFIKALDYINNFAFDVVKSYYGNGEVNGAYDIKKRNVVIGKSKQAQAWTDASMYIAINSDVLQNLIESKGIDGIIKLHWIMVHEYLHLDSSDKDHVHSPQFYEDFHEIILGSSTYYGGVFLNSMKVVDRIIKEYNKQNLVIPKTILKAIDKREKQFESVSLV